MTTFRPFRQRPSVSPLVPGPRRAAAFTLIEILVVIGIILLLSAILFPAFKGIQERGAQTTCASNMQQIYLAVRLYKDDEREYPSSLAVLLPDSEYLEDTASAAGTSTGNVEGTGYFRKTREELVCPDDDFQVSEPVAPAPTTAPTTAPAAPGDPVPIPTTPVRSSYGDTSTDATKSGTASSESGTEIGQSPWKPDGTHNPDYYKEGNIRDWGRLAWNYWGYDEWGQGFRTETEALNYARNAANAPQVSRAMRDYDTSVNPPRNTRSAPVAANVDYSADDRYNIAGPPAFYFNPRGFVTDVGTTSAPYEEPRAANMMKYSLSNPQAPLTTIITHCSYHRLLTANNIISPAANQLYDSAAAAGGPFDGTNARDIVLRLDGTARSYDVTKWNDPNFPRANHGSNWQVSDF